MILIVLRHVTSLRVINLATWIIQSWLTPEAPQPPIDLIHKVKPLRQVPCLKQQLLLLVIRTLHNAKETDLWSTSQNRWRHVCPEAHTNVSEWNNIDVKYGDVTYRRLSWETSSKQNVVHLWLGIHWYLTVYLKVSHSFFSHSFSFCFLHHFQTT